MLRELSFLQYNYLLYIFLDCSDILIMTETNYIIVLAGGLKNNGHVNDWVQERLDKTIELYNEMKYKTDKKSNKLIEQDIKIICCGGGTYHKPPVLDLNNYVIHESTGCASYLIENGISKRDIYKEWSSYDTIANAYFATIKFLVPLEIKKIILVTSEFHMKRSVYLFNKISKLFGMELEIETYETENNMDSELLEIRAKREKESVVKYKKNIFSKIKNKFDFTKWIHEEHNAYNNNFEISKPDSLLSKSY